MASDEDTPGSSVERALVGGTPQRVDWYRFHYADERWEWSPEVELIHGYLPGSVNPTTELALSHKHPEDFEHVATTLENIRRTHKPFSTRHRIVTVQGAKREVVVIGATATRQHRRHPRPSAGVLRGSATTLHLRPATAHRAPASPRSAARNENNGLPPTDGLLPNPGTTLILLSVALIARWRTDVSAGHRWGTRLLQVQIRAA